MLTGRKEELNNLNNFYNRSGSQIVVVYGQRGVGKTRLLREFTKDKDAFFYECRECSEREQQYQWGQELNTAGVRVSHFPDWEELFAGCLQEPEEKPVLVIDEFQYIIKSSNDFMDALVNFVNDTWGEKEILVVLISSSTSWVENSMVKKIGEAAYELAGLLKIRQLNFFKLREAFSGYPIEDAICLYGILGGVPGLWTYMSPGKSLKKNICDQLISSTGALRHECVRLLSEELRELNVYNSILSALASGHHKLNDIYSYTGFSRAKISVYLKNLMELELIEKVFSYDTDGRENVQKGVYRISNHFIHFYFTYLYPNKNKLEELEAEQFYIDCIQPHFRFYTAFYFKQVCLDYLLGQAGDKALPIEAVRYGEWVGKAGNIDMIIQNDEAKTLVGYCNWEKPMMTYADYEWLLFLTSKARVRTDYIWLFSGGQFDEKLYLEAKVKGNLKLISLRDII